MFPDVNTVLLTQRSQEHDKLRPLPRIDILSTPGCDLCQDATAVLLALQAIEPFTRQEINSANDPERIRRYGEDMPVVFINGRKAFTYRVAPAQCLRRLRWQHRPQGATYPPTSECKHI